MKRNLFDELKAGFAAYDDYAKGKITLKTQTLQNAPPVAISPAEIRAIREQLNLSQAVFANRLKTSVRTLQGWEQGKTKPNPQAALLLKMVAKLPNTLNTIAAL